MRGGRHRGVDILATSRKRLSRMVDTGFFFTQRRVHDAFQKRRPCTFTHGQTQTSRF
jgi:hypothetical protein